MSTEDALLDISEEVSSGEELFTDEAPLLMFRVIGCTFVTLLVGFIIILYVTSSMNHVDSLAQLCGEFYILCAYMLILLTTTEPSRINKNMCITISFFLHICFVGAFLFSFLEVVCISQVLVPFFRKRVNLNPVHIIILGFGIPLAIAGLTVLIWLKEFTRKPNCWVDLQKSLMWLTVIPIGACIILQVILLFIIFFTTDVPISVPQSQYKRAKCFLSTRWASAIILINLTTAWSCGVMAYNTKQDNMYAAFTVSSILLGVCIFTLRISTDDEIRAIIVADLLCFLVPKNKVTSFSTKPLQIKKNMVSDNQNGIMNGKILETEDDGIISHK